VYLTRGSGSDKVLDEEGDGDDAQDAGGGVGKAERVHQGDETWLFTLLT